LHRDFERYALEDLKQTKGNAEALLRGEDALVVCWSRSLCGYKSRVSRAGIVRLSYQYPGSVRVQLGIRYWASVGFRDTRREKVIPGGTIEGLLQGGVLSA
jgi:hypothetical protein